MLSILYEGKHELSIRFCKILDFHWNTLTTIHNCMKTSNSYEYLPVVWEQFETCPLILAQYTTIGAGVLTHICWTQTRVTWGTTCLRMVIRVKQLYTELQPLADQSTLLCDCFMPSILADREKHKYFQEIYFFLRKKDENVLTNKLGNI